MKMILFASALALGSVAYAQDAMQPGTTTTAPSGASSGAPGAAAQPPTDASSTGPASAPMSGDTSGGMSSGSGATGGSMSGGAAAGGMSGGSAAATDDSNLPMCSKTVTDKCKSGSGSHHAKAKHSKMK